MGKIDPFRYDLPKELIAQRPVSPPDSARLLIVSRQTGAIVDTVFSDLDRFVVSQDRFVFNNTRVLPARLYCECDPGGKAELLLIRNTGIDTWSCIGKPLKKIRNAKKLVFTEGLEATVESSDDDVVVVKFLSLSTIPASVLLYKQGVMPIPPYIRQGKGDSEDVKDYQTIFAKYDGSIAAPTASLHFTQQLLEKLEAKNCLFSYITLHVGTASFLPVIRDGEVVQPGSEEIIIDDRELHAIKSSKAGEHRVVAVGTTVVRAIESSALSPYQRSTSLFITPGYQFKLVDLLITNFHQSGTTHMLLVEALLGRDLLQEAYAHAIKNEYRFLSYGDGMMII